MNNFWKILSLSLLTFAGMSLSSCSEDDDVEGSSLSGTKWEITSCEDDEDMEGVILTFEKNGHVTFAPESAGWDYAVWTLKGSTLKIVLGEDGEPDDYIQGNITFSGKNATYKYSWHDYQGRWDDDEIYTMTLRKK